MRKNAPITFLIYSILLICGCSSPYSAETKEFKEMLDVNFHYSVPEEGKNIYLLIPSCQCKNCIVLRTDKLSENMLDKIHIVSSIDTAYFPGFSHYLFDEDNKLMRLSFLHYANQIVLTEGPQIVGIIRLRDFEYQMDSIGTNWLHK